MYCPKCRLEYPEGFNECSDCHISLLPGTLPSEAAGSPDPTLSLVVVLETSDRIQLAMAKGLLGNAGIPFFVLGEIVTLFEGLDPVLYKRLRLQVPGDRETEARELLEPLLQPEEGRLDI
jgi:hypothetical protein